MYTEITNDYIRIYQDRPKPGKKDLREVVGWDKSEWMEDPSIVPSIANAIRLSFVDPRELNTLLGKTDKGPVKYRLYKITPGNYKLIIRGVVLKTWSIYSSILNVKEKWIAESVDDMKLPAFREKTKQAAIDKVLEYYNTNANEHTK